MRGEVHVDVLEDVLDPLDPLELPELLLDGSDVVFGSSGGASFEGGVSQSPDTVMPKILMQGK